MDVDGLAAGTFTSLTRGLDLNEIVVIAGQAELHGGFIGDKIVEIVVTVSFQQHLQQRTKAKMVILSC